MSTEEIRAILIICLLASFADGEKHEREREQIRQVAEGLATHEHINLPSLYQDVLLRRVNLAQAIAQLKSSDSRMLAYEMAVCVCDADGHTSPKEEAFLRQLHLQLNPSAANTPAPSHNGFATPIGATPAIVGAAAIATAANTFATQAHQVADAPLQGSLPTGPAPTEAIAAPHPSAVDDLIDTPVKRSSLSPTEMDRKIVQAAIMNGAIELLPENLSTLAIIPLQMRLVYQIGQSYGYELDRGHIKDLLAALGVGLTSQYLEEAGRKLLGGLLGKGIFGGLGKQAVSSGMSFASTYALGHVANQYYAGGRTLSTDLLKSAYQRVMQDGKSLQSRYLPQMQETARGLNTAKIMSMVRGGH